VLEEGAGQGSAKCD
jgi:hypothetical protein